MKQTMNKEKEMPTTGGKGINQWKEAGITIFYTVGILAYAYFVIYIFG